MASEEDNVVRLLFPVSGNGDCIFCIADNAEGTRFSMMIDCHVFTSEIKDIVTDTLKCHLDYLVVTHIDNDHIDGICNMLYQMPELKIDHIIFNNLFIKDREDAQIVPLSEFEKEQINKLKSLIPKWKPCSEHKVAAKESLALSSLLQTNWDKAWNKKLMLVNGEYLSLAELGKIFIVSPTRIVLDELYKEILNEYAKRFYVKYPSENGKEKEAEIFELLSLIYNQKDLITEKKISNTISTLEAEYIKRDREDSSKTNRSSIAFVWELDDKKILLLGDAASDVAKEGILAYKIKNQIPFNEKIIFDAIKVSHHGSDANLSKELLKHIDSQNWIFCGSTSSAPHLHTIANIIYQPLPDSIFKRRLFFNSLYYKNNIYNNMKTKAIMLEKEGIRIDVVRLNEITL